MKHSIFLIVAMIALNTPVLAKSTQVPNLGEDAGIITPAVATGMRTFHRFNNDTNGNMVVCTEANFRGDCDGKWVSIQSVVPKGRTFVGFRIVSGRYDRLLEVYWK